MDIVYRTSHPDVLAALAQYRTDMAEWHDRAATLLKEFGFEGRHFLVTTGLTARWISGVERRHGEQPPTGWRVAKLDGKQVFKPHKATNIGKTADKEIGKCQPPADLRSCLPGMPGSVWEGHAVYTPALEERDGAVWLIWKAEPKSVDTDIWERVKLSEYWAAVEAEGPES